MKAEDLMKKVLQAAASAKVLLDTGDADLKHAETFVAAIQTEFMPNDYHSD